jgi:hypothetical protein
MTVFNQSAPTAYHATLVRARRSTSFFPASNRVAAVSLRAEARNVIPSAIPGNVEFVWFVAVFELVLYPWGSNQSPWKLKTARTTMARRSEQ